MRGFAWLEPAIGRHYARVTFRLQLDKRFVSRLLTLAKNRLALCVTSPRLLSFFFFYEIVTTIAKIFWNDLEASAFY